MADIDFKGTQPGLINTEVPPQIIKFKCRSGDCTNMDAEEVPFKEEDRTRAYRCTKCHHMTILDVGGGINI